MRAKIYMRSWWLWARAIWLVLSKKHGAGGGVRRLPVALMIAKCVRFIVYGQRYKHSRCFRAFLAWQGRAQLET